MNAQKHNHQLSDFLNSHTLSPLPPPSHPQKPRSHHHHNHNPHELALQRSSGVASEIAVVAWMIIFGDGFHNFLDGLSIGAAFSENILTGISISLAVLCEELPHELGEWCGDVGFGEWSV